MRMAFIDWAIVGGLLAVLIVASQYTRRYGKSVVNFLAAGRCAGRYLIAVAEGVSGWGAISAVAAFEMYYTAGFSIRWWYMLTLVMMIVISMSGWMTYRFRQTRCLTLAQYLEKRYSRKLRIFAGILAWFSGILNFGLFPAVGSRFFIYFCGLPEEVQLGIGGLSIAISTYKLVMLFLLAISLYFIFMGGQVAVIVTDFLQGLFCMVAFAIVLIYLGTVFDWEVVTLTLTKHAGEGQSLLDPLNTARTKDFGVWYYVLMCVSIFYGWMSWQGTQGYRVAARTPHEARMAMVVNNWRAILQEVFILVIPICAFVFLHSAEFSAQAAPALERISAIAGQSEVETTTLQTQMSVPVAMSYFLGKGLVGLVCAVMLAAFISTHDTYLHSWGSIFIQDVIMPFRKKPLSQEEHIRYLRWSIFGVAAFIFTFSVFYSQNEYILMFMAFTGSIFVAGAGIVSIGGLYWKRGTTDGAWAALILGMVMSIGGAVIRRFYPDFPLNSQWIGFITILTCITTYVVVSLLQNKVCDMDRMLHRGKYAVKTDHEEVENAPTRGISALLLMGSEFTRLDKVVYIGSLIWSLSLCGIFAVGMLCNAFFDLAESTWARFWWWYLAIHFAVGIVAAVWFVFGGLRDLKDMFALLRARHEDESDDGRVVD